MIHIGNVECVYMWAYLLVCLLEFDQDIIAKEIGIYRLKRGGNGETEDQDLVDISKRQEKELKT